MDIEVIATVAHCKVVGHQLSSGCVVANLVARIPAIVPAG